MAHIITEFATFDPTVTVPDGTDSRLDAAEVVAAIAQSLANRTKFIKAVTDVAARTNVTNTFVPLQNFSANVAVTGNVSCSDLNAADDVNATDNLTAGNDAIIGRDVTAVRDVLATRDVASGRRVLATQGIYLPGDQRIEYIGGPGPFPSLRTRVLPLEWGVPGFLSSSIITFGNNKNWVAAGGNGTVIFPLFLPNGAILSNVIFNHTNITVANAFVLRRRTINFTTPGVPETDTDISPTTASTGAAEVNTPLDPLGTIIDNTVSEYSLEVQLKDTNILHGIQYQFLDPGPRNE